MKRKITELVQAACVCGEVVHQETILNEISLDSLSFIMLLVSIEQEYGMAFNDEDFNIKSYDTVSDIIKRADELNEQKNN